MVHASLRQGIALDGVCVDVGRGRKKKRLLDSVSFDIAPSERVAYVGANGAGKSTTIRTIVGIQRPSEGSVHVGGIDVRRSPREAAKKIGAVSLFADSNIGAVPVVVGGVISTILGLAYLSLPVSNLIGGIALELVGIAVSTCAIVCVTIAANTNAFWGRGAGNEIATAITLLSDIFRFPPTVFILAGLGSVYPGWLALPFGYGAARAIEAGNIDIALGTLIQLGIWITVALVIWRLGIRHVKRQG